MGRPWLRMLIVVSAIVCAGCTATTAGSSSDRSAAGGQAAGGSAGASASVTETSCPGATGGQQQAWSVGGRSRAALSFPAADGAPATTAIVVSNQSDQMRCSWAPFVATLRQHGAVWLYDYDGSAGDATGVTDLKAVAQQASSSSTRHLVLLGASKGAKASLVAGVTLDPAPVAVVALSPEANLADGTPVLDAIQGAGFSTLIVTADDDPYQAAPASHAFAAARPAVTTLLTVPGADHGTALLAGASGAKVTQAVAQFLAAHP